MAQAIGAVLVFAVGVGISPIPIIAVILMLFSQRARVNGPLFLAGWLVGLTVVVTVAYLIADAFDVGTSTTADDGVSWLRIGLGLLLVLGAWRKWRSRPRPGDEPTMPTWMAGVDRMTARRATELALVLAANPKNLMLAVGAGASLAQLNTTTAEVVVAITTFVLVGSAVVMAAVVYDLFGGARARSSLDDAKAWLTVHNSAVMAVLFLVFGAVLISQGLGR